MQFVNSPRVIVGLIASGLGASSLFFLPGQGDSGGESPRAAASASPATDSETAASASSADALSSDPRTAHFQSPAHVSDDLPSLPFGDLGSSAGAQTQTGSAPGPSTLGNALPVTPPPAAMGFSNAVEPPILPSDGGPPNALGGFRTPSQPDYRESTAAGSAGTGSPGMYSTTDHAPSNPGAPISSSSTSPSLPSHSSPGKMHGGTSPVQGSTVAYQAGTSQAKDGNGLRSIDDRRPTPSGRMDPASIATGLPHVTPAPRQRYATSPYNHAVFQTAAYQRTQGQKALYGQAATQQATQRSSPGQLASNPSNSVSPTATQQVLPQYAQPGPYPSGYQCPPGLPAAGSVPGTYAPPTYTPDYAPSLYASTNVGCRPILSLGQQNYNVVLGRGIIGQPTAYVPGQPVRNFMRYIFP